MAYTDGYDYDIFISYSHDDDDALEGKKGWVADFHWHLSNWLVKKRALKGLRIWIDEELSGNTLFEKAIEDRINRSALFFVIHSRNYQDSDYCRKELDWFFQHNNQRPEGLTVGDESRLFNILINNIPYDQWPESLSKVGGSTSGFILHDADKDGEFGYPTESSESLYNKQLRKLVEATAKILEAFPKKTQKRVVSESSTEKVTVFLADVSDTLRRFRKRLIVEIGDTAKVLDALPPPYPLDEHKSALDTAFDQASLSIHLLDQWPGHIIEGTEELSYPRLQADKAILHPIPSLIWRPGSLQNDDIEDPLQADWLEQLEQGERKDASFQFIRSGEQALFDQVRETISTLQQQVTRGDNQSMNFLIDTHQKDQRYAFKLGYLLEERDIDVEFTTESYDPVKSLTDFEQKVRRVRNLIIMFGKVGPDWLKGRIKSTLNTIAEQFGSEDKTLKRIWVVLLPGCPGKESVPELPLQMIELLDNTSGEDMGSGLLEKLLHTH